MDLGRRFMLAGLLVAAAEVALGTLALPTGLAPYLFACAALTVTVGVAAHRLMRRPPRREDDDDGPGGPPRDDPPPPWWPEFERGFRSHVREQERRRPTLR